MIRSVVKLIGAAVVAAGGYLGYTAVADSGVQLPSRVDTTPSPTHVSPGTVVRALPDRPGYDRDCGRGRGCVFGPAWSDDTTAPMSHNGCDTRNDVRRTQLRDVQIKPGTNGCVVTSGTLVDPYDGRTVRYVKGQNPVPIQVDHVLPLHLAWNAGADRWTQQKRASFANDPRNLLVTSSATNRAKSDQGPAQWAQQINDPRRRCSFLAKAKHISDLYGLATTHKDAAAFATCATGAHQEQGVKS